MRNHFLALAFVFFAAPAAHAAMVATPVDYEVGGKKMQSMLVYDSAVKTPLLAAVGPLQLEVVQYRLESEYGAESRLEQSSWTVIRWLPPEYKDEDLERLQLPTGARLAFDNQGKPVALFANDWSANYFVDTNPKVTISALPPEQWKQAA